MTGAISLFLSVLLETILEMNPGQAMPSDNLASWQSQGPLKDFGGFFEG